MEFRVLGPLAITRGDAAVVVTRHKCQALLALLLSRYPHAISTDAVANALWPDTDPAKAINSVRVNATYLRQALAVTTGAGPITSGRYALSVGRGQIDATRLEDLAAAAREAAAAGDPHRATDLFAAALAEWRGEPYADFPEIDALREEVARLGELRLDTLEGYATALLDDDRADEVCRLLSPVVDEHLSRETLVARLMLGLHRTGRFQDALALLGRVKDELGERGMGPSPELQRLADAIVLHDPELDVAHGGPRTNRRTLPPRRRAAFIGRDYELRALRATWDAAGQGTPQLAYVAGVAGIGKTTLTQRFVDEIRAEGGSAVVGQCDSDPGENYQPFPDLVRTIISESPPTDTGPSILGELARLTPDLADRLPAASEPPEAGAGRQRLFGAVTSLLAVPAQPRLIVIDDLHWVRSDALLLLRHLLRHARGQLMVIGTYRDDEIGRGSAFGAPGTTGRVTRPDLTLRLGAMNQHEVAAVIDAVAPLDRRAEWLGELAELTEVSAGNPLRLREVLRQLELEPEAHVAEIAPDDVRDLVDRRVGALDPNTRSVLQTASVLGRGFTLTQIASATGLTTEATLDALEESMDQGLVVETDRVDDFTFAHPLFRNAILFSLSKSRRARIHLRCGDVLAAARAHDAVETSAAEVARHFVSARPVSDAGRTAILAREAGDDAAARYAHVEAVGWYRHAVECAPAAGWPDHDLARLRLILGIELERSGELDAARVEYFRVANIARAIGDIALLIDVVVAATPRSIVLEQEYGLQLATLADEAIASLAADDPTRVRLLRSAAYARYSFDPASIAAISAEADRLVTNHSDPQNRGWAIGLRYIASADDEIRRLDLSRELRHHSERHDLVNDRGIDCRRFLIDLMVHGAMDEFDQELEAMSHLAQSTSIPFDQYWVAALHATRALMRDASSTTEEIINGAALLGRQLQIFETDGMHMLQTFALRYQQDRAREVSADLSAPTDHPPRIVAGTALLALGLAEGGRIEPARRALDRVVTDAEILLPKDNFWFAAVALFSGVAAAGGNAKQRRVLRCALEPRAELFCVFGAGGAVFGTGHHWLARLAASDGDLQAAREHLSEAARICDDAGARFWAARARSEKAAVDRRN